MSLPSVGNLQATQNTNKQISQIRSYLNQLKDELEAELMNVGYDNLNADLKKRLSSMSDDIQVAMEGSSATYEYVSANYISADEIAANYVATRELSAQVANLGYVTATQVNAQIASFGYVTAAQVNAQIASFGYVTAAQVNAQIASFGYVTADYLATNYLTASAIASNYLKTNELASAIARIQTVTAQTLQANAYRVSGQPAEAGDLGWISWMSGTTTYYAIGSKVERG